MLESAAHLFLQCPFAKELWHRVKDLLPEVARSASHADCIPLWWRKLQSSAMLTERKKAVIVGAYVVWNIWKERNNRIFHGKKAEVPAVKSLIDEDLEFLMLAGGL